jgi:hypothetical protein
MAFEHLGHPELPVLAAEDVGDRRLTHPPSDADPGVLLGTLRQLGEQIPEPSYPRFRHLGSLRHCRSLP